MINIFTKLADDMELKNLGNSQEKAFSKVARQIRLIETVYESMLNYSLSASIDRRTAEGGYRAAATVWGFI